MAKEQESFRRRTPTIITGPSRTKQEFKNEADINTIVSRHLRTNMPFPQQDGRAFFGDVSSSDFQAMMNQVADIEFAFSSLPARLRRRFSNSPYQLVRWVEDPDNREEAEKLGLLRPSAPPATASTEAGNTPSHLTKEEEDQIMEEAPQADPEANPRPSPSRPAVRKTVGRK